MTEGGEKLFAVTKEEKRLKKIGKGRVEREKEPLTYFSKGKFFNKKGLEICGVENKNGRACQRIGTCPYHNNRKQNVSKNDPSADPSSGPLPLPKGVIKVSEDKIPIKTSFRYNWNLNEHLKFLRGINKYGKGKWKSISSLIESRDSKQVNSHAQKYFQLNPDEDLECAKKRRKSKKNGKRKVFKQSNKTPKSPSKNSKSLNSITISSLKDEKKVKEIAEIYGIKDENHLLHVFPFASKKEKLKAEKRAELRRMVESSVSSPVKKKKIKIKTEADIPMKFEINYPPSPKNYSGKDNSPKKSLHSKPSSTIFSDDSLSNDGHTDSRDGSILFDDLDSLFPFSQEILSSDSLLSISESEINLPPFEEYSSKLEISRGFMNCSTSCSISTSEEDEIDVFERFERRSNFDANKYGIGLICLGNDMVCEDSTHFGSILGKRNREEELTVEFIEEPVIKKRKVSSSPFLM